jgi:hypothetical protein
MGVILINYNHEVSIALSLACSQFGPTDSTDVDDAKSSWKEVGFNVVHSHLDYTAAEAAVRCPLCAPCCMYTTNT